MTDPVLTYPGAPASMVARWNYRRISLRMAQGEALPELTADLASLAAQTVTPDAPPPPGASRHARKWHEVRQDVAGLSELAALNALLIAHLRKRRAPRAAAPLFRRIWIEQSATLIGELPSRWLISSAITFGDHGATETERCLGRELNVLFSLMKLYEYERIIGGVDPTAARLKKAHPGPMPLDMPRFSLRSGGLDVNLLAPIWLRAEAEPVMGPLALALLGRLNADPANIFRRLTLMRARRSRARVPPHDPAQP
ncbi:MAG: hypothetical protein ACK4L4_03825 [Gemmobacter sp.]